MAEERDRDAVVAAQDLRRVGAREFADFVAGLGREHHLLEAPRRELAEVALRLFHRERHEPDAGVGGEAETRRLEHPVCGGPPAGDSGGQQQQEHGPAR